MNHAYAPVVLFVYNRYDHVYKTLDALSNNTLAGKSDLIIFSDGYKSENDAGKVKMVREVISDSKWVKKFKSVRIVESDINKGLAQSIINGVSEIINEYGKVIVIEDDCVSACDYLSFMNDCLDYYENNERIWSIGGYSIKMDIPSGYDKDVYIMGRTCSYAWGTWIDRWTRIDWNVKDYEKFKWSLSDRARFNQYGNDRAKMLDEQQLGIKNSWAIRFCYAMFRNDMYTIYPVQSRISNIGYTEGTNVNNKLRVNPHLIIDSFDGSNSEYMLTNELEVNEELKQQFVSIFNRPKYRLFLAYIVNVILRIKR